MRVPKLSKSEGEKRCRSQSVLAARASPRQGGKAEANLDLPSITSPTLVPVPWHSTYAV